MVENSAFTFSAISNRVTGGGTFFRRIQSDEKAGFSDKTYDAFLIWFSDNWPGDLPWPKEIERPKVSDENTEDAA